jgi:hypothetical protein
MDKTGGKMYRRVRAALNPVSSAVTRWWCLSALRHTLTGYGPTASQRRLIKRSRRNRRSEQASEQAGEQAGEQASEQAGEQMRARAGAIDELMARPD